MREGSGWETEGRGRGEGGGGGGKGIRSGRDYKEWVKTKNQDKGEQ